MGWNLLQESGGDSLPGKHLECNLTVTFEAKFRPHEKQYLSDSL